MPSCRISIYHSKRLVRALTLDQSVVVGRRDASHNDPPPIVLHQRGQQLRLIIADQHIQPIPRSWFKISPTEEGSFTVENLHPVMHVSLPHDRAIPVGGASAFEHEVLIDLGQGIVIRVEPGSDAEPGSRAYRSIDSRASTPGHDAALATKMIRNFAEPDAKEVAQMLRVALQVVQNAAGSDAFFQAAVAASTEIVDLDRTVLLLRSDSHGSQRSAVQNSLPQGWCVAAEHANPQRGDAGPHRISATLLNRVIADGKTVVHDPLKAAVGSLDDDANGRAVASLQNVECAVAAPVLNHQREVIGVLYGDRKTSAAEDSDSGISDVEATLVEILAGAVAGGMARCAEERLRSTLSEFFSPKVAGLLATNPELMEGQDVEITVLFCDVRGFSAVTEKLGPKKAIEWINDVMSELSQCVIDRDGVLVDYVGDELLAMWGAPGEQPDHAARAIDAARAMLEAIEVLRSRWSGVLPRKFGAGIGVNTGPARVGNVGSRQKFKYGALGNTVNLGSRLQSATKQLGVACVSGSATVRAAGYLDQSRRLAKLAVVGIEEPIEVYEIVAGQSDSWSELREKYQQALLDFEGKRFSEAAGKIGSILHQHPDDRPSLKLLARAVAELDEPSKDFCGVWQLTSK